MGYKFLGFIVWQGGKWYLKRRARDSQGKLAIAGLTAVVAAGIGVLIAQRQRQDD
jgi:hypothetical protein